jgi:hypothetical protein
MSARAGRRILLLFVFAASVALFTVPAEQAFAGERGVVSVVPAPRSVTRTVPVSTTRRAIPSASRPMTASQMAATHGLTYHDAGTYVLLERGTLRVRIYPGTSTVVVAGREYRVKDPALRSERDVVLSKRVSGFLNHRIGAYRADERSRERLHTLPRPRFAPLPPLPPKPVRRKPIIKPVLKPKPAVVEPPPPVLGAGRGWIPPVGERKWKWIVIHHSDDLRGNVAKYDNYHRNDKGWEHGCGYHFVIGNGSLSGDGEIELGPRWPRQLHGAHAKTPDNRFNDYGVGICLVGKFNEGRPSAAQMDSLVRLVRWLKARYGIEMRNIHGHCDCCTTDCPGKNFPWATLKRRVAAR